MWNTPCHCDCNYEHLLTAGDVSILLEKESKTYLCNMGTFSFVYKFNLFTITI